MQALQAKQEQTLAALQGGLPRKELGSQVTLDYSNGDRFQETLMRLGGKRGKMGEIMMAAGKILPQSAVLRLKSVSDDACMLRSWSTS